MIALMLANVFGLYSCSSFGSQEVRPFNYYFSKSMQAAKITVVGSEIISGDASQKGQECGAVLTYTVDKTFFGTELGGQVFIKKPLPLGKYYALIFETGDYEKFADILSKEDIRSLFCYTEITPKYIDIHPRSVYPIIGGEHVFVEERNPLLSEIDEVHKGDSMVWHGVEGFKIQLNLVEEVFSKAVRDGPH